MWPKTVPYKHVSGWRLKTRLSMTNTHRNP